MLLAIVTALLMTMLNVGGIETLFGIFKSRGFNLEDTHLVDSERLSRLFALLTIAFMLGTSNGSMAIRTQTNLD